MDTKGESFLGNPIAFSSFKSQAEMNTEELAENQKEREQPLARGFAEVDELYLYQHQEGFRLEDRRLQEYFDATIQKMKEDFATQLEKIAADRVAAFRKSIKDKGMQKTQREMVPAYKFGKFPELPFEIRNRIWSMAIRIKDPQKIYIMDMKTDSDDQFRNSTQSSRVFGRDSYRDPPINALRACRESRTIGKAILNLIAVKLLDRNIHNPTCWANVIYDEFYMVGGQWNRFKLLVDIFNATTTPSPPLVQKGLDAFANIRLLNVEFRVFAAAPPFVWTHFKNLAILTIGMWPMKLISQEEYADDPDYINEDLRLFKILKGGSYEKRAQWLHQATTKRLVFIQASHTSWKLPIVHIRILSEGAEACAETYGEGWSKSRYFTNSYTRDLDISLEDFINEDEVVSDFDIPDSDCEWHEEAASALEESCADWEARLEIANKIISDFRKKGPPGRDDESEENFSDIEAAATSKLGYEVAGSDEESNAEVAFVGEEEE